jgi:hypothetical protein
MIVFLPGVNPSPPLNHIEKQPGRIGQNRRQAIAEKPLVDCFCQSGWTLTQQYGHRNDAPWYAGALEEF